MKESIFSNENEEFLNLEQTEQLRMENEVLRLKIQAQFGGMHGGSEELPPEIENQFLKQVLAFEESYTTKTKKVKISEMLGHPVFRKSEELNDAEFESESERLAELLKSKSISIDFIRERDDRFQYKFITEEFFEYETDLLISLPGMMHCFCYEEFHPDHEMDIENRTKEFMNAWFERQTEFANYYLSDAFIQPDGKVLSLEELKVKLRDFFDSWSSFEKCEFRILEIKFQLQNDREPYGLGHAEGMVRYDAILESGKRKTFEGPFKLYLSLQYEWWNVFYFVMEGFNE